jgi:hypothetical protein
MTQGALPFKHEQEKNPETEDRMARQFKKTRNRPSGCFGFFKFRNILSGTGIMPGKI